MTTPQFKAPPIPPHEQPIKPAFSSPAPQTAHSEYVPETPIETSNDFNDLYADTIVAKVSPSLLKAKNVWIILGAIFFIGIIFGAMIFGGGSSTQPQQAGLSGVISNPDIQERLRRCGQVDKGEACILYIVNHSRYDKIAEDFFDEAVKLTEAQRYSISMVNPKYAKTRIPPGYFAQIKIPNVR